MCDLLAAFTALSRTVVLVSCRASDEAVASVPPGVQVIRRPNEGYDFESYRVGLEAIGDDPAREQVVMMNSSFVCMDPGHLIRRVLSTPPAADLAGITACRAPSFHVQSYFFSFEGRAILGSEAFRSWWSDMRPISEREEVVKRYEIGMSAHFAKHGFRVGAAFAPDRHQLFRAVCRFYDTDARSPPLPAAGPIGIDLSAGEKLNPVHFLWDDVLNEFAIIKLELVRSNPYGVNLHGLHQLLHRHDRPRQLIEDALGIAVARAAGPAPDPAAARTP